MNLRKIKRRVIDQKKALSIYVKHDFIMPYDEMFERAECCGILHVRVFSSLNKLNLIHNKFSKDLLAIRQISPNSRTFHNNLF